MKATWDKDATYSVLDDVAAERKNQVEELWGVQHHPDGTNPIAYKPLADQARERTDLAAKVDQLTWLDIAKEEMFEAFAEREWPKLRKELIQTAAVIVAWVEDGDGGNRKDLVEQFNDPSLTGTEKGMARNG
jgi:hypothetical protein